MYSLTQGVNFDKSEYGRGKRYSELLGVKGTKADNYFELVNP